MAKHSIWSRILDYIVGTGGSSIVESIQEKVAETIDTAEIRMQMAIKRILAILSLFIIIFLGLIFILVGFANYLTERVDAFNNGVGFIIVGGGIIVLALIIRGVTK